MPVLLLLLPTIAAVIVVAAAVVVATHAVASFEPLHCIIVSWCNVDASSVKTKKKENMKRRDLYRKLPLFFPLFCSISIDDV